MANVNQDSSVAAESTHIDPSVWKITAVAMIGSLLAQLDATIINVSLSSLAAELNSPLSTIQWVTSGYLLALTFALPLNGWLIERIGAKALYIGCFSIFTLSSVICGLAWSVGSLIGFRLLQGASGGLLAPMAQMMMKRAAGNQFTRIAGYAAVPVLLGPVLGPVIAGGILHVASWRWLFLVNLPVGLLALLLAIRFLPNDRETYASRKLDWQGLTLLSPGLALLLFGTEHISKPHGIIASMSGLLLLGAFLRVEKRKGDDALIDLALFRQRSFSAASVTQFLFNGVMFAGQMLVPVFLIQACGRTPAMMGWMLAPMGLGMMIVVPSLGFLTRRLGERLVAVAGAWLSLLSTLVLVWQAAHGLNELVLAPALFARGMGLGAVGLPAVSLAYASIRKDLLPMATTTLNIVQRMGGPTLTTLCAVLLARAQQAPTEHVVGTPWVWSFLLLAALHASMTLAAMLLPRPHPP